MRTSVRGAIRDQKGNVLILVLVLLVVGGLILGPLLGLMGTGLVAGQVYEKRATVLYACDAGIEDAVWQLLHNTDGLPDKPYPLGQQVNGMVVTVEKIGQEPMADGATLYTIRSTAAQDRKTIGEVIAEVKWQPLPMVEGSSPGKWIVPPPYVDVLTTLNSTAIAFGMQLGAGVTSAFNATSDPEPVNFDKNDLLGLDLAACHAWIYFRAEDYGISQGDSIGDAHHYYDYPDEHDYLLAFLNSPNTTIGTNKLSVNQDQRIDIVRIHVDPDDPQRGEADLFLGNMMQYFSACGNPGIGALGRLEYGDGRLPDKTGHLLFSVDKQADLLEPFSGTFDKSEVIILDLGDPAGPDYPNPASFELYLDAWTHILSLIEGNSPDKAPAIVALSPLPPWKWGGEEHPDGRLLLAFDASNKEEVIGSDGKAIKQGDIAIWTPDGWTYEENESGEWKITDYGQPYSSDSPGEITLHIDMNGSGYFEQIFVAVSIVSWNVER